MLAAMKLPFFLLQPTQKIYSAEIISFYCQGFQVLVESDWLDFGHKFGDRCGHQEKAEDQNEQCPVFLQWLDSVHQLLKQFPCLFEFNEAFLVRPSVSRGYTFQYQDRSVFNDSLMFLKQK